jgi:ribokinase
MSYARPKAVRRKSIMKALCFGSLNIDYTYKVDHFLVKGETLSSESLNEFCGGKGLNQSVALSRAGAETFHAGAIGEDGKFLLEQLKEAGVDTGLVKILDGVRSGHTIIQNDKTGDNCILLYGGANRSITKDIADEVISNFEKGDYILLQNEISELKYIMEKAHERGLKIVLNPSPMDSLIEDLPLDYVDIFMLNELEAGQLLGWDRDKDFDGFNMAKALLNKFEGAAIVLTLGSEGAIYVDENQEIFQPAFKVQAVDTTAAGDTFTGFFIGGQIRGLSVKKSLEEAAKASAIAVTRPGASPSIPTLSEVEQ